MVCAQVRLGSLFVGAGLGSKVAGCPPVQVKVAWLAYVTQAGVALGLIKSVTAHQPVWGPPFGALLIAVVVCNLMVSAAKRIRTYFNCCLFCCVQPYSECHTTHQNVP
jgi:hypothetical protein